MRTTQLTLINPLGLHARAASKFVDEAKSYGSKITLVKEDKEVDGKSIMSLLLLGAPVGSVLELIVEGDDEDAATDGLSNLVEAGFHELDDPDQSDLTWQPNTHPMLNFPVRPQRVLNSARSKKPEFY